jgi:predicted aspartyl protease
MARCTINRRDFAGLIGASTLLAGPAFGMTVSLGGNATRLTPADDLPYIPPTSLAAVADIYRRMTVPILVAGQGPYPFVVDTGANQSVISEELVAALGLPHGEPSALNGIAGVRMTPTTLATLQIGGRAHADVVLSILPSEAIGGQGMLGLDRLEGQRLTLDFRGQALRIEPPGHLIRDPAEIALKARRRDGQLTLVDADIAGIAIVAFLDSGAQNTIGNLALEAMSQIKRPTSFWTTTKIVSATGQTIDGHMANLPQLRIGGMRLPNWPVAFADLHTFQMWDMTSRPAILIGVDVLSRFERVCLDFARNEVRFHLPEGAVALVSHH